MRVITLLGLPASGKSYYGKMLAERLRAKFIPEIATQIIHEKEYKVGIGAPPEFDRDVFEMDLKVARDVLRSELEIIAWEGGPVLDCFFLEGRLKLGAAKSERGRILKLYDNNTFRELSGKTTYVIFNVRPGVSLKRQRKRGKPELLTPDLELLKFVHSRLINFYEKGKDRSILINVDKAREDVFKEVEGKISRMILNQPQRSLRG